MGLDWRPRKNQKCDICTSRISWRQSTLHFFAKSTKNFRQTNIQKCVDALCFLNKRILIFSHVNLLQGKSPLSFEAMVFTQKLRRYVENVCVSHSQLYMGVSKNSGFSPQTIHLNRVFHYKPSILGEHPYFSETSIFFVGENSFHFLFVWFTCVSCVSLRVCRPTLHFFRHGGKHPGNWRTRDPITFWEW